LFKALFAGSPDRSIPHYWYDNNPIARYFWAFDKTGAGLPMRTYKRSEIQVQTCANLPYFTRIFSAAVL
jgi:hypothetical protein